MKIKINKDVIKKLNPCSSRFDNYLQHYDSFNGNITKFLDLENISHSDKLWVSLRVMPRHLVEIFAIDMSFSACQYAVWSATYATYAADAAARSATYAAARSATYAANAADATYAAARSATYAADAARSATYAADAARSATDATYADDAADAARSAADAADAAARSATYAADAAARSATDAADARKLEQDNQISILKYLINSEK
jgi:hypothetical protein